MLPEHPTRLGQVETSPSIPPVLGRPEAQDNQPPVLPDNRIVYGLTRGQQKLLEIFLEEFPGEIPTSRLVVGLSGEDTGLTRNKMSSVLRGLRRKLMPYGWGLGRRFEKRGQGLGRKEALYSLGQVGEATVSGEKRHNIKDLAVRLGASRVTAQRWAVRAEKELNVQPVRLGGSREKWYLDEQFEALVAEINRLQNKRSSRSRVAKPRLNPVVSERTVQIEVPATSRDVSEDLRPEPSVPFSFDQEKGKKLKTELAVDSPKPGGVLLQITRAIVSRHLVEVLLLDFIDSSAQEFREKHQEGHFQKLVKGLVPGGGVDYAELVGEQSVEDFAIAILIQASARAFTDEGKLEREEAQKFKDFYTRIYTEKGLSPEGAIREIHSLLHPPAAT